MIHFDISKYIDQYLGRLFANEKHTKWANVLLQPLKTLWAFYETWRQDNLEIANMQPSKIYLEKRLNKLHDPEEKRVFIAEEKNLNNYRFFETESQFINYRYAESEGETPSYRFFESENPVVSLSFFMVVIPDDLANNTPGIKQAVENEVRKYKAAGFDFTVLFASEFTDI